MSPFKIIFNFRRLGRSFALQTQACEILHDLNSPKSLRIIAAALLMASKKKGAAAPVELTVTHFYTNSFGEVFYIVGYNHNTGLFQGYTCYQEPFENEYFTPDGSAKNNPIRNKLVAPCPNIRKLSDD